LIAKTDSTHPVNEGNPNVSEFLILGLAFRGVCEIKAGCDTARRSASVELRRCVLLRFCGIVPAGSIETIQDFGEAQVSLAIVAFPLANGTMIFFRVAYRG
jgi:hypothetical protein